MLSNANIKQLKGILELPHYLRTDGILKELCSKTSSKITKYN